MGSSVRVVCLSVVLVVFLSPADAGVGAECAGGEPLPAAQNAPHAAAPTQRLAVVDQAIAFHGGDAYRASETELDLCSRSGCSHLKVRVDGELFDYTVTDLARAGQPTIRITNQTVERWQDGAQQTVRQDEEARLRDAVMARVYFPFLPYRLNDPSVFKQDLGVETWEGRELHRVKVTFKAGTSTSADDEYLFWLDPETARVEQFAYSFQGRPGGLRFRRASNYRRVGGILFFDQENLGVEGPGLRVDQITPAFVNANMRPVSTVTLKDIEVRAWAGR